MRSLLIAIVLTCGLSMPVAADAACWNFPIARGLANIGRDVACAIENGVERRQGRRSARQAARRSCAPAAPGATAAPCATAAPGVIIERHITITRPLAIRGSCCPSGAPCSAVPELAPAAK